MPLTSCPPTLFNTPTPPPPSLPPAVSTPQIKSQQPAAEMCLAWPAVGQFKELVESSETDQPLQETLKKVLNFTSNGWHKAREHAMRAVSTDNRMRAWCADDSLEDGLLFKCYLGRVDLEAPVGEPHHQSHMQTEDMLFTFLTTSHISLFLSCS